MCELLNVIKSVVYNSLWRGHWCVSYHALAGGILCHQWNIKFTAIIFVVSIECKNLNKSTTELELFELTMPNPFPMNNTK